MVFRERKGGAYTAGIERTWIQAGQRHARCWLLRARLLRPADGVRNGRRHRGVTLAEADVLVGLQIVAALPGPGVVVEALDLGIGEVVRRGEARAALAGLHVVRGTGAVGIWLRAVVRQGTGGAADVLADHQRRAEGAAGVVLVEVRGGDAALRC